jgi:LmbE family N-acetylglucosaminyl deacetylase
MTSTAHDPKTVLHVGPHADDELIGAPAALMALRDAGWTIVNVTCSLGAEEQRERRRAEVAEACRRAGFVSEVVDVPLEDPLTGADVAPARDRLVTALRAVVTRRRPRILVAPSPHDRHRGHEVAGRAALQVCATEPGPERLWLWGLWADLPFPSLAVAYGEERMEEILSALAAHSGELARNDYRRLVRGRADMCAVVGPERVFGFGTSAVPGSFVELLSELGRLGNRWVLARPRWLHSAQPIGSLGNVVLDAWLHAPSLTDRFGVPSDDTPSK